LQQQPLVATILWSLWKNRNSKLWEDIDNSSEFIVTRAKTTINEWSCIQRAKLPMNNANTSLTWSKPPEGTIKCNVDAASFNNNSIMGYGICFRNSSGVLIIGKSGYYYASTTVLEAETIGLLEAIKEAISTGMQAVIFETDCKTIPDALSVNNIPENEFGDLIFQCKSLLLNRPDFVVSYVRRQANRVAHSIARASLCHPSPHIFNVVPSTLYSLIMNEMA
jgi:ribonuclease HI